MSPPTENKERELLAAVEDYLAGEGHFGIDPQALEILENADSTRKEIAAVEEMISKMIAVRLRSMADSASRGMNHRGKTRCFNDVIAALGMRPTKYFIVAMALFSRLGITHARLEIESFAIALFARVIAEQMNFDQIARDKAELGGLFLNLGRVVIAIYQTSTGADIDPAFVEKYHWHFADEIITRFNLPDYLIRFVHQNRLALQRRSFSAEGVVYLAQSLVEKIIGEFGVIEIKSPMPEVKDNLDVTLGSIICDHFNMIGLGKYVNIAPG